jgi:hypothetical protein
MRNVSKIRLLLGVVGLVGIAWGARLILINQRTSKPFKLIEWLIGAVILHDGILVPITLTLGAVITVVIPPRARRYVQGALIAIGLVAAVAVLQIYRRGDQEQSLSLLQQDYAAHLALIAGIIVAITAVAYSVRVILDRRQPASATNVRPPASQTSPTE